MACALVEAVAEIVRTQDLPAQARARHEQIRATCEVGPVTSVQGAGLLVGLNTRPPAREVVTGLRQQGILVGTSADPHTVRLMPPLTVGPEHIEQLAQALGAL